ncbi:hypothetical protein [Catenulispora rubra]|uniref:hypothetical protein n=1 Tax=Catenulispora rubra TaxID=280293 RepID=UPI001892735D|nr:hypothetical protein [Catenulispora rubra]
MRKNLRWAAVGAVALLSIGTGVAFAASGSGKSATKAGPAADTSLAACTAAGRPYCPGAGQPQGADPQALGAAGGPGAAAQAQPMTEQEAVSDALRLLPPAPAGAAPMATPHHVDTEMTLASYEQKAYGGKHVNTAFSPQAVMWVIQVDAPADTAVENVPQGTKPTKYSHFTVVFDVTSHHWVEKHLW